MRLHLRARTGLSPREHRQRFARREPERAPAP